jgi:2-methylisocitrate lyase-like PEP mutase family enzyme
MSELSKRIGRVQRRETAGGLGFGALKREKPRATLLAVRATDAASAGAAISAGADVVLLEGGNASAAKAVLKEQAKACLGVLLKDLDEKTAGTLHDAGVDFVVSPLAATASAAVDTERMGQAVSVDFDVSDAVLRSLGPLGLDALYVDGEASAPTLAGQVELVRLASFSGLPLIANVEATASAAELRVLRDSGVAVVVAPAGTSASKLKDLIEALEAVPPPRRGMRGGEIAIVPSAAQRGHEEDDEVEEPE